MLAGGTGSRGELEIEQRMVAEILSDARQIRCDMDTERAEIVRRADAGAHEERGAAVRARRDDHLVGGDRLGGRRQLDADRARALEKDAVDQDAAADRQVRSRPRRGEVGESRALPDDRRRR